MKKNPLKYDENVTSINKHHKIKVSKTFGKKWFLAAKQNIIAKHYRLLKVGSQLRTMIQLREA